MGVHDKADIWGLAFRKDTGKMLRCQGAEKGAGCWWFTPIILATQEGEIRRITV
jgi:hypothetical protein